MTNNKQKQDRNDAQRIDPSSLFQISGHQEEKGADRIHEAYNANISFFHSALQFALH